MSLRETHERCVGNQYHDTGMRDYQRGASLADNPHHVKGQWPTFESNQWLVGFIWARMLDEEDRHG